MTSRHIKIGQTAPLSRIKVGQYIKFPDWHVVYKLIQSYSTVTKRSGEPILRMRPSKYDYNMRRNFPIGSEFTEIAFVSKELKRIPVVTVVAKPRGIEE